jgi:hypothetical protein
MMNRLAWGLALLLALLLLGGGAIGLHHWQSPPSGTPRITWLPPRDWGPHPRPIAPPFSAPACYARSGAGAAVSCLMTAIGGAELR